LVGQLQTEPGSAVTPLDKEIKALRTSPELMPYLMPMPVRPSPKNNPKPDKRPAADAPERPNKYQKGKGKGKNKGKAKSKQGTIDIPQGCVAKTPDGKPLCFAFNKGVCGFRASGPRSITFATNKAVTSQSHITSAVTLPSDKSLTPGRPQHNQQSLRRV